MYGQKIRNTIFEKKHDKLKPIGLPFIPKILSKQDYFSALKGFSMIADAKTLTKEISIHEDFEILDLEDQFSIIQINSQKDFNSYIKNSLTKKNVSKYSFSTNTLLKNVIWF